MNKQGFTLIELLVVVLIIGILAAIAIPKYAKTVEITRSSEVVNILENMAKAENIYYMTNGKYTTDLTELDIQFPYEHQIVSDQYNAVSGGVFYGGNFSYSFWQSKLGLWAQRDYKDGLYMLQVDFQSKEIVCAASSKAEEICSSLGFTEYYTSSRIPSVKKNIQYNLKYYKKK